LAVFQLLVTGTALFASPEDSPLYRFRSENHAVAGHRGRVNALAFVRAPVENSESVLERSASSAAPEAETLAAGGMGPETEAVIAEARTETPETEAVTSETGAVTSETGAGSAAIEVGGATPVTGVGYVLTVGEDGFLGIWGEEAAIERYQLSEMPVSLMKAHPDRAEIAYVESDGLAFHQLNVINYWTKTPLYSLKFEDRINYIDYTAGGSFLIVITGGQGAIHILDSRTGREARPPIAVQAVFAAASPSERTLVVYSQTGRLTYWNLQTGRQTAEFPVAASFYEPIIFRNYNLLAGWVNNELLVINATTGRTLIRERAIPRGLLLPVAWDDEKFAVSSPNGVTIYAIDSSGTLVAEAKFSVELSAITKTGDGGETSAAISVAGVFYLGTENGGLIRLEPQEDSAAFAVAFSTDTQIRVTDALVYDGIIHYITASGSAGQMPAAYNAILNGEAVPLPAHPRPGSAAGFPVSEMNGKQIYLEAQGPVVRAADGESPGRVLLSVFLPLTIDADFADDENIVVVGMLSAGTSSLQLINIATGETVPIDLPDDIVLKVHRGESGSLYAALSSNTGRKTRLIKLDMRNPRQSRRLVEIGFEDDIFDLAEAGNALVTNLGSTTADFYDAARGNFLFSGERTGGVPVRIIGGGPSVLVIDDEGSLVWLDRATGRAQAVMRIYADEWELSAADGNRANGR
jgi:WD40 repeat protein